LVYPIQNPLNSMYLPSRTCNLIGRFLLMLLLLGSEVEAAGLDLHWLWDNRCAECHGHSGEFARRFLQVDGKQLQGRHHVQGLRLFLGNHYLLTSEIDAVYEMLLAQASTRPRFRQECGNCHGDAAAFVRRSMKIESGDLVSRKLKQSVHGFMESHRALQPDDIEFFVSLLRRVANEVYRP